MEQHAALQPAPCNAEEEDGSDRMPPLIFQLLFVSSFLLSFQLSPSSSFDSDGEGDNPAVVVDDIPPQNKDSSSKLAADANKIRHMRGKYTVKEEVIKRVEINHPCRLTRTGVKVAFPSMRTEVLVSFIGYREPRLMFVNRCKGLCSSEAIGRAACVATKKTWKKVNMQLTTQVLGQESREKFQELVLEEHEECACHCLAHAASLCLRPELFNNDTCSCACDGSYQRERVRCESSLGRRWDDLSCTCRRADEMSSSGGSSVDPYVHQWEEEEAAQQRRFSPNQPMYDPPVSPQNCHDCLNCLTVHGAVEAMTNPSDYVTRNSWTVFSFCLVCISFLSFTTIFYWRRYRHLREEMWSSEAGEESAPNSPEMVPSAPLPSQEQQHHPHHKHHHHHHHHKGSPPPTKEKVLLTPASTSDSKGDSSCGGHVHSCHRPPSRLAVVDVVTDAAGSDQQQGTSVSGGGAQSKKKKQKKRRKDKLLDPMQTNMEVHDPTLHVTTFMFGDDLDPNFASLSFGTQPFDSSKC